MLRTGRELPEPQGAQLTTQRLTADRNAQFFLRPERVVDQTPAHHAVEIGARGPASAAAVSAARWSAVKSGALRVARASGPPSLKRNTPLSRLQANAAGQRDPDPLKANPARPSRVATRAAVEDHPQSEEPARLVRVLAPVLQPTQIAPEKSGRN